MLDQETVWQIGVAVGAVALFLVLLVVVSSLFAADGSITATGGFALVGAIVAFILLLSGAGLWLERQDFDENGS